MGDMPIIFVNNTGHTIRTILAGLHGKAIFPVFADHTDGAILTVNSYRRAVCTVDADGSVFTISSFFTKVQIIIYIHLVGIIFCAVTGNSGIFPIHQFSSILGNFILQLADIHSIRSSSAGSHIVNLVATIIQSLFCQRNCGSPGCRIFRRDRNTPSTNRCLIPIFIRDSHAASLGHGLITFIVEGSYTFYI